MLKFSLGIQIFRLGRPRSQKTRIWWVRQIPGDLSCVCCEMLNVTLRAEHSYGKHLPSLTWYSQWSLYSPQVFTPWSKKILVSLFLAWKNFSRRNKIITGIPLLSLSWVLPWKITVYVKNLEFLTPLSSLSMEKKLPHRTSALKWCSEVQMPLWRSVYYSRVNRTCNASVCCSTF